MRNCYPISLLSLLCQFCAKTTKLPWIALHHYWSENLPAYVVFSHKIDFPNFGHGEKNGV